MLALGKGFLPGDSCFSQSILSNLLKMTDAFTVNLCEQVWGQIKSPKNMVTKYFVHVTAPTSWSTELV